MNFFGTDLITILTYSFLFLSVILLWVPKFTTLPLWSVTLVVSIIFGLLSNRIEFVGLIFILLFALAVYCLQNQQFPMFARVLSAVVVLILGIGLEKHLLPGFHNLKVLNAVKISHNGIPFTLYLNFDKTIVGIFILGFLHQRIATKLEWLTMFKKTIPLAALVIVIIACLSFAGKVVRFDFKIPQSLLLWACTNLLFVCVAEEAFFRGFIQKYLSIVLKDFRYGYLVAIVIASLLFGLDHYPGPIGYMTLAAIAGLGYGWIYFRTERIEASIITHFSLNLLHFLAFTYPALATLARSS